VPCPEPGPDVVFADHNALIPTTMTEASPTEPRHDAKYASEAFEFLRLFQRIGRSLTGLVFLELGWTLLTVLATRLAGTSGTPMFTLA
jgi:hypothetical protein